MVLYATLQGELSAPDHGIEGSQSSQVEHLLGGTNFAGVGSEQDAIVFYSHEHRVGDPAYLSVIAHVLRSVQQQSGVEGVVGPYGAHGTSPRISADRHAAIMRVALSGGARARFKRTGRLQDMIARASAAGISAWLTGFSPLASDLGKVESTDGKRAEAIGVPVALVILIVALGALSAAVVPLLIAGAGLLFTFGLLALLGSFLTFDALLLTIVTMAGIGIGIDYSLFIVSRFREELACTPEDPHQERERIARAVGVAISTSGRTILYSGVIVALALVSLLVIRSPAFREIVVGVFVTVLCTLTAALTLLPAVLAQLGPKINAGSLPVFLRPANVGRAGVGRRTGWARWAEAIMRRPVVFCLGVSLPLLALAAPAANIRYGISLDLPSLSGTTSGKGAVALARSFSSGTLGPLDVVVTGSPSGGARGAATNQTDGASSLVRSGARMLAGELRGDRRVSGLVVRAYGSDELLTVLSAAQPDARVTDALVRHIRNDLAPMVHTRFGVVTLVGGWSAQAVDASEEINGKFLTVLGITLGLALIFLLVVFRSVVLPIKAVAMNLLGTSATLGLVVLIFQDGRGERLLGFSSPGFIQVILPPFMFVLLFGLSMDYEVFLIRRMQETWRRTGDNRLAVVSGVEQTARPISAAAAIMVVVFGSSLTANNLELKEFGFALATAIVIDATLIRLVLIPALMRLLGERNWWLPDRLTRFLPHLDGD
jgi:RND superfamily putative drug exporter